MAHHKRRRRRRGGVKGCCHMCSLRTTDGRRNGRNLTLQEERSLQGMEEQLEEVDVVCRPRNPVRNGYSIGSRVWGPALHVARVIETGDRVVEDGRIYYTDGATKISGPALDE